MEVKPVRVADIELSPEAVRERFAWAVREGNPLWLWPETRPDRWQNALVEIERVSNRILSGHSESALLDGNPTDIGIAAFTSGMGPLLGYWAGRGLIKAEPAILNVLELHFAHNLDRMERLITFAAAAVDALAHAGVEVTVLKGMHTAYSYFPTPGSRPVSDIDLWIDAADLELANSTLAELGYRPDDANFGEQSWRMPGTPSQPRSLSVVHRDGPWSIDLHSTMNRRYSGGAPVVRMDRALQGRAQESWPQSPSGHVLTGAALVLHLAFHASLGLTSLSMLRLTELVFVIRQLEGRDRLPWEEFMQLAALTGNPSCTYPALALVNRLAPGTVPQQVIRALRCATPATVRRVIDPLSPANCQRVTRCSFQERFMWTTTPGGWAREIATWLFPAFAAIPLYEVYKMRFWRLVNRTFARRNPELG